MSILNITPDSFSDGGQFKTSQDAIRHGLRMLSDGAHILDIGGESTRPGAVSVTLTEELERVIPVIRGLRLESDAWLSVDTTKMEVARQSLLAGADMVNDVSGMTLEPEIANLIANTGAMVCIMHRRGTPDCFCERIPIRYSKESR